MIKFLWTMLIVITVIALVLMFTGCSGRNATELLDNATVVQKGSGDILYEILSNKDHPDELRKVLNGFLQNGEVNDRDHTSTRLADNTIVTTEKWFLKDAGNFLHAVLFEQRILVKIFRVKDKSEWEKIQPEPYGGWRTR